MSYQRWTAFQKVSQKISVIICSLNIQTQKTVQIYCPHPVCVSRPIVYKAAPKIEGKVAELLNTNVRSFINYFMLIDLIIPKCFHFPLD
jgi:hypothetical protein